MFIIVSGLGLIILGLLVQLKNVADMGCWSIVVGLSDALNFEFLKPYGWARINIWKYSGVEEVLGGGTRSPRGYLWSESSDEDDDGDDDGDDDDDNDY